MSSLYQDRKFSAGHMDLERLAVKTSSETVRGRCGMRAPAPACLPDGRTPKAAPRGRRRPCRGVEA